jgi:hypothetical protein
LGGRVTLVSIVYSLLEFVYRLPGHSKTNMPHACLSARTAMICLCQVLVLIHMCGRNLLRTSARFLQKKSSLFTKKKLWPLKMKFPTDGGVLLPSPPTPTAPELALRVTSHQCH